MLTMTSPAGRVLRLWKELDNDIVNRIGFIEVINYRIHNIRRNSG